MNDVFESELICVLNFSYSLINFPSLFYRLQAII